jgi:hypothetical protein
MLRRLRLYFTGFALGLLVVYVVFLRDDSRDLDIWTPSQRVLEDIRNDSSFQQSAKLACFTTCLDLSHEELTLLWSQSEVKSLNPGGNPYRYAIQLKAPRAIEAEVERTTSFRLISLKDISNPKACACP